MSGALRVVWLGLALGFVVPFAALGLAVHLVPRPAKAAAGTLRTMAETWVPFAPLPPPRDEWFDPNDTRERWIIGRDGTGRAYDGRSLIGRRI